MRHLIFVGMLATSFVLMCAVGAWTGMVLVVAAVLEFLPSARRRRTQRRIASASPYLRH